MNGTSYLCLDPIDSRRLRNNPRVVPHFEEPSHRFATVISIVERTFVYVHADKLIGELGIEIAGKLHGVAERFFAMINGILDALAQRLGDAGHRFWTERAPDGISAERQRQSGNFLPPPAEIDDAMQSGFVIRELAFMDDETCFVFTLENLRNDLIEGNDLHLNAGREQFERQ